MKPTRTTNPRNARLHFSDGRVEHFDDQKLAYALWLALPKGVRAAFRGANDTRPVYLWTALTHRNRLAPKTATLFSEGEFLNWK
jgi:hypothetical protein